MPTPMPLATTPRDALGAYIHEIETEYYPWYETSVKTLKRITIPLQFGALVAGFASSILAAAFTSEAGPVNPAIRIVLIVLPALGSAFTSFLVQARLFDHFQLRENGRFRIQSLATEARLKYACLTTDAEFGSYLDDLRKRVDEVEATQGEAFFGLVGRK